MLETAKQGCKKKFSEGLWQLTVNKTIILYRTNFIEIVSYCFSFF